MEPPSDPARPAANVYESNGWLCAAVPLPGAHADTVEVHVRGRRLTIQAESRYPQEQQNYLQHEWHVGRFHRDLELPRPVETRGAKATLSHGILTVMMPIVESARPAAARVAVVEAQVH